ncbi:uncharacterized protein LOC126671592 [Mercurialis annua]|uniref:uncharacterized protein LOC126671592 n=1 Tax=Mercurialis annua TaxID=3986 RepID=UPI00215E0533|nr:uncharacterized protein LOC126671592 [Mercurialis annua]
MNLEEDPELVMSGYGNSNSATRCCFCFPSTVGSPWWQRFRSSSSNSLHPPDDCSNNNSQKWWSKGVTALKKFREWSEIVAGPKWKTFIRRFNRTNKTRHQGKFQYDPLSYSLNFDQGNSDDGYNHDDDYGGFRDFSTRYASVSASGKPLAMAIPVMEVDGRGDKDAPVIG